MSATAGRVLITPRSLTRDGLESVAELAPLTEAGYELVAGPAGRLPSEDELRDLLPGCRGWLAGVEPITEKTFAAADALRVISRNGSGVDSIDLDAAAGAGVRVERAAGPNAQGVAELTLALTLSMLRHVPWSAASVRAGGWPRQQGRELAEITVGVVGLGEIGRRVAGIFGALGSGVIAFDPFVALDDVEAVDLPGLVARADVITLHCPPPADGAPLIDAALLETARPAALLINTARAALVDDDAVLAALTASRLDGYAVDAFAVEPPPASALLHHERVLATPHIGGFTAGSVRRATAMAVENLLTALRED